MSKQAQSLDFSRSLLWCLLVMFLVVGLTVAAIYSMQRRKVDERQKAVASESSGQFEQQHRLKIKSMIDDAKRMREELKAVDKQLKAAREEADSPIYIGPTKQIQAVIAESMKTIEKGKSQLVELTSDLARCETALENGREACMEQIWILEDRGGQKGLDDPSVNANHEQIAKETRIVEELELKKDKLIVYNHYPNKGKLKSIQLAIKEQDAKIAELTAAGAGAFKISPEQLLQSYIVGLKQQIGDVRLSLSSDLEAYRSNYENAVKSYDPDAKVKKLENDRAKLEIELERLDKQILSDSHLHHLACLSSLTVGSEQ